MSIQQINEYSYTTLRSFDRDTSQRLIPIAASIGYTRPFLVDCISGRLYMRGLLGRVPATPHHPPDDPSSHGALHHADGAAASLDDDARQHSHGAASDDVLRWLEEFGERLASGYYDGPNSIVRGRTPHFRIFPCTSASPQYEGPPLFVNSDACVNTARLHTHLPLQCSWYDSYEHWWCVRFERSAALLSVWTLLQQCMRCSHSPSCLQTPMASGTP
jgi:hypothetical protein